jgi:hypothetical protein
LKLFNMQFSAVSQCFFPLNPDNLLSKLPNVRSRNQAMTSEDIVNCEGFDFAVAVYRVCRTAAAL